MSSNSIDKAMAPGQNFAVATFSNNDNFFVAVECLVGEKRQEGALQINEDSVNPGSLDFVP